MNLNHHHHPHFLLTMPSTPPPPPPPLQPVTPPSQPVVLPSTPTSTSLLYKAHARDEISDALLKCCTKLFGETMAFGDTILLGSRVPDQVHHLSLPPSYNTNQNPGAHVKMSACKLQEQCVSTPQNTVLIVCYECIPPVHDANNLELVRHAFATMWDYPSGMQSLYLCY